MENNTQKHSAKKTLLLIAALVIAAAAMFCIYKVFIRTSLQKISSIRPTRLTSAQS